MKKIVCYSFTFLSLLFLAGCGPSITKINTAGPNVYKVNTSGFADTVQTKATGHAEDFCKNLKKEYLFIRKNTSIMTVIGVDVVTLDLIFSCVDNVPPAPDPAEEARKKAKEDAETLRLAKEKMSPIGDTPGAPESLGAASQPPDRAAEQQEGEIVEEKIIE